MGKVVKFALSPIGALLGAFDKPKMPEAPKGPPVMPMPDDEAIRRAKKQAIIRQMSRGGRESTILTDDSETLGG